MTLEQLRIFVAVAEQGHVTRAARTLNLTQAAASASISALENRYGITLFNRVGRRIELTEAGRVFLDEARAVLSQATSARTALDDLAGLRRGSLTIHASQTVANYWLPPILCHYRRRHPGIDVRLVHGNTRQVARAVHDGAADLGFVEGAIAERGLIAEPVTMDTLVLVVGRAHPWAFDPPTTPDRLTESTWVLREHGSGTRAAFEAALEGWDLNIEQFEVTLELPSNEAVRTAVAAGTGATAISRLVVDSMLRSALLSRIDLPLQHRPFHMIRHQQRRPSAAMSALFEMLPQQSTL